jgi:hypothetical protein
MSEKIFEHIPHEHIRDRRPPRKTHEHHGTGLNAKIATILTRAVSTMWCAYFFAILALIVVPQALNGGMLTTVQWISQTFVQLVMLSVIMVGQNILGRAGDERADMTYKDAEAVLHEALEIQRHLEAQDKAIIAVRTHLADQDKSLSTLLKANQPLES